jgi:hypothetical protein
VARLVPHPGHRAGHRTHRDHHLGTGSRQARAAEFPNPNPNPNPHPNPNPYATPNPNLGRLKKSPGYTTLRALFESRHGPPEGAPFKAAQARFSRSLAAYSVLMWMLLLRDRYYQNL